MKPVSILEQLNQLFDGNASIQDLRLFLIVNENTLFEKEQMVFYTRMKENFSHPESTDLIIYFMDHNTASLKLQKIMLEEIPKYNTSYQHRIAEALIFNSGSTEETLKSLARMKSLKATHYWLSGRKVDDFTYWPLQFILNIPDQRSVSKIRTVRKLIAAEKAKLPESQKILFDLFCKDYQQDIFELLKLIEKYGDLSLSNIEVASMLWKMESNTLSCEEILAAAKAIN